MTIACRKSSVRESAAQFHLDALLSVDGGESLPCFFSVLPTGATFQTISSEPGEKLLAAVAAVLGPPATLPQTVKGGSCGGEEEDGDFAFTGSMLSVTWEFPRDEKEAFLDKIRCVIGAFEGIGG